MDLAEILPENAIELGQFGFLRVLGRRSETDLPRSDSGEVIYRVGRAIG